MALRPVFVTMETKPYVKTVQTEFKFFPGFALSQNRKSIESLHENFVLKNPIYNGLVLEISSKSDNSLGCRLSAFNLMYCMNDGKKRFVENVFQASKCFSNGKQYDEILDLSAAEAKHFPALRTSGNVVGFRLEGKEFKTEPKTLFYDWLYVNALYQNNDLADMVSAYRAFTDIAFNPTKSINCQARSVALFVGLKETGILDEAVSSPDNFLTIAYDVEEMETNKEDSSQQLSMF